MNRRPPLVKWAPSCPNVFLFAHQDLRLMEIATERTKTDSVGRFQRLERSFRTIDVTTELPQLRCMEWSADAGTPHVMAAGMGSGKVAVCAFNALAPRNQDGTSEDPATASSSPVRHTFTPRYSRPCHALSWNPVATGQLAAGLDKIRSDYCTLIWDVSLVGGSALGSGAGSQQDRATPLRELANSEATVALSWIPGQGHSLATGTGLKWLRIYDTRQNAGAPMSVIAHAKAVHGVSFDPHAPSRLLTYSEDGVIKLWDLRSFGDPLLAIQTSARSLSHVAWSPVRRGVLASTSSHEPWVSLWQVDGPGQGAPSWSGRGEPRTLSQPYRRRYTGGLPSSFAWESASVPEAGMGAAGLSNGGRSSNRVLVAATDGSLEDLSLYDSAPITVCPMEGLGVSAGPDLFVGALPVEEGGVGADVSSILRRRAAGGVSVHVDQNARLLSQAARVETSRAPAGQRTGGDGAEAGEEAPPPLLPLRPAHSAASLAELWQWCAAVDTARRRMLQAEKDRISGGGAAKHTVEEVELWSRIGASHTAAGAALARAGACSLIEDGATSVATSFGPLAGWDSAGRRVVASLCGWGGQGEGEALATRAETDRDYARAALLSAVHGSLAGAVHCLQRGAAWHRDTAKRVRAAGAGREGDAHAQASERLYFAAAVVSGFPTAQGAPATMWVEQCLDLVHERFSAERQPHLVALCVFLAAVAARGAEAAAAARTWLPQPEVPSPSDRAPVLDAAQRVARRGALERVMTRIAQHARPLEAETVDFSDVLSLRALPLRTRLAFAARFLADEALHVFVEYAARTCAQAGRLEGVPLTGLSHRGCELLQRYLDATGDVQTPALLLFRCPSGMLSAEARDKAKSWVFEYRDLLNRWRLWPQRALLDVGMRRAVAEASPVPSPGDKEGEGAQAASRAGGGESEKTGPEGAEGSPLIQARCNFCGQGFSLRSLIGLGAGGKLKGRGPKLSHCPNCKKPLPRCTLCLRAIGTPNPHHATSTLLPPESRLRGVQGAGAAVSGGRGAAAMAMGGRGRGRGAAPLLSGMGRGRGRGGAPPGGMVAGVSLAEPLARADSEGLSAAASAKLADWWTWCQTCKHGGHALCQASWFAAHTECPASNCNCRCMDRDPLLASAMASKRQAWAMTRAPMLSEAQRRSVMACLFLDDDVPDVPDVPELRP